jgi:hypothetical protein
MLLATAMLAVETDLLHHGLVHSTTAYSNGQQMLQCFKFDTFVFQACIHDQSLQLLYGLAKCKRLEQRLPLCVAFQLLDYPVLMHYATVSGQDVGDDHSTFRYHVGKSATFAHDRPELEFLLQQVR